MHKYLCVTARLSKKAKLLKKLMSGKQDRSFTFSEAEQLLFDAGFVLDGGKGSHQVYRRADGEKMILPRHGKDVKPVYIRTIRKILS